MERTDTVRFTEKGDIRMIAHRGVSGLERENTCPAFVAAGVKSYFGIETDVHVTKDERFIIFHDNDLKRLLSSDIVVEETDFDTLRGFRMKDTDGATERNDLFMPSLEEYISICGKYKKTAVLELKSRMEERHIVRIADIIIGMGWFANTIFISFSGENLIDLRRNFPAAEAQYLFCDETDEALDFMKEYRLDADIYAPHLTKEYADRMHAAGIRINCWTVDSIELAERVRDIGVEFITSNILE